jgi:hypothetical protein
MQCRGGEYSRLRQDKSLEVARCRGHVKFAGRAIRFGSSPQEQPVDELLSLLSRAGAASRVPCCLAQKKSLRLDRVRSLETRNAPSPAMLDFSLPQLLHGVIGSASGKCHVCDRGILASRGHHK